MVGLSAFLEMLISLSHVCFLLADVGLIRDELLSILLASRDTVRFRQLCILNPY